ncbi:MAG: DNA repair protein, partial [Dysgonamonadaceae bacterium]|nr:DNA repair protein [Dysgonamonadaceae bacterium]
AITDRAASIVVAHNHPSGDLEVSPDDIEVTHRLQACANLLGIPLLDHIIVTKTGWKSII